MAAYKIISFDKSSGAIAVSFDDKMAPISIDVPLDENGLYITGDELDTYIQGFIPTWHLDRVNRIAAGVPNESDIEALVTPVVVEELALQDVKQIDDGLRMWQEFEAEKQIARVLLKFGVIQEDPTKIPVATL